MELEVTVELGPHVELLDRGLLDTGVDVAAEPGAAVLLVAGATSNALALEGAGTYGIPLAEAIGALETAPLESLVRVETTSREVEPVKTLLEVVQAETIRVLGGGVGRGVKPAKLTAC